MGKRKQPRKTSSRSSDERVRRSKEAVLAATAQLLSEAGFGGVSVDAVSERSGVAKTTIYRHWPSRSALLLDACSQMGTKPEVPDTGSLQGDVAALAAYIAGRLSSDRFASVLPSIVDAAERDPEIAGVHARLHAGHMAPLRAVLERAQQRGELSPGSDHSAIIASLVGPLFYRRWFSHEALDEHFVRGVVERALGLAKPRL